MSRKSSDNKRVALVLESSHKYRTADVIWSYSAFRKSDFSASQYLFYGLVPFFVDGFISHVVKMVEKSFQSLDLCMLPVT
jgi:hypothetical protein